MKLSITIVTYHTPDSELNSVLTSVRSAVDYAAANQALEKCDLFIVSNGPQDNTLHDRLAVLLTGHKKIALHVILNKNNIGFGRANNTVLSKLDSDFHLILNPDITFDKTVFLDCIHFMHKNPSVGLVSPQVHGPDQEVHRLYRRNITLRHQFLRRFAPNQIKKMFSHFISRQEYADHDPQALLMDVPFLSGCFMFFRTQIFKKLGGFDPRFFLYVEDADITRRALALARTAYVPDIVVCHEWKRGSYKSHKLTYYAITSSLKYFWKWSVESCWCSHT